MASPSPPFQRPTLRAAAQLLAAASDPPGLLEVAALCSFRRDAAPLDAETRVTLGVPEGFREAWVARGPGTLRALVLVASANVVLRESLGKLATRLATRSPHVLWLALACGDGSSDVAIAAWDAGRRPPRVVALVADRRRVLASDAETVLALASARDDLDVLTHARWLDVLGRDALTRRFYRALERLVREMANRATGIARAAARREIALLYVSRLLFLSFLEAKGWLDDDRAFLVHRFDTCMAFGGRFQERVLLPLFFGTLNTPVARRAHAARAFGRIPFLNGGLFARTPIERLHASLSFRDEEMGALFGDLIGRYRFTAREDSTVWSEAAIDPEMMGKAFESLMAAPLRRGSGAFYTPQSLVMRVTDEALQAALIRHRVAPDLVATLLGGTPIPPAQEPDVRATLSALRVLDPACGSGAFLVHALERIAGLHITLGDDRPVATVRRSVLATSIFGVDVNPTAVWLCELRLWLSVLIESNEADPLRVPPLPNLDRHVRAGDSLAGGDFRDAATGRRSPHALVVLRDRYARAVGSRKRTLIKALEREERAHALAALDQEVARLAAERRDLVLALRSRDLFGDRRSAAVSERDHGRALRRRAREARTVRRTIATGGALPFGYAWHFPDIAARGGFDVVIGNPPWVRVHHIPLALRLRWRPRFAVYRDAGWRSGARAARASAGFGSQIDLSALFLERALDLTRPSGTVALLVPGKLWRSLAGGGLRHQLAVRHRLLRLEDWSDARALFDAAVYPSLVVVQRRDHDSEERGQIVHVVAHGRGAARAWDTTAPALSFDHSHGSPWLLAPPLVRRAFDLVMAAGPRLGDLFGAPTLGVKCGVNEAFVVEELCRNEQGVVVRSGLREGLVEGALLRPLLRGEFVASTRSRARASTERIIWTHDPHGRPLDRLPPHAARWLAPFRARLEARSDMRGHERWWSLFRTDGAAEHHARVVWPDVACSARATVLEPGDSAVPLNSCYVIRCADRNDAHALSAILNTTLAWAWLALIAEPARGNYRRLLGWTMALYPLPADWARARALLAPVGNGSAPAVASLGRVLRAYRLSHDAVAPLLEWSAH